MIAAHRAFLADGHDPDWLTEQLEPLRAKIRVLLEQCAAGRHTRTANFAAGLLEEYDALWTFCDVPDLQIDPTNNAAERAVRHAVLQRRLQGGTQSDHGSRWIERIQSVRETCRLQGRPVLGYLTDAATAAHHRLPVPHSSRHNSRRNPRGSRRHPVNANAWRGIPNMTSYARHLRR